MGIHHVAYATRDLAATHRFYTEAMGFRLVKVESVATEGGGWAKHLFYDAGGGSLIAFWDLHDDSLGDDWRTDVSTGLGLPAWVNHLAFSCEGLDDLGTIRQRWQDWGITVAEIDHGWCTSIYATDPNGILVEFSCTTREFTDADVEEAGRLLDDPNPAIPEPPAVLFHRKTAPATA